MSDATERLKRLGDLTREAQAAATAQQRVEALARLQRLSGWALRDAVDELQESGVGYREIAPSIQVPWQTLYAQHVKGGRIVVRDARHAPGHPLTIDDEMEARAR